VPIIAGAEEIVMNRYLAAAAVGVVAVGALTLAPGRSAQAAGWAMIRSTSGGAWLRVQPTTASYGQEYLGNGTSVLMICWVDAQWATGNYSSNRWFEVEPAYDPAVGYVHSSLVANQVSVPHC
jgi:hypothetical protein